MVMDRRTATRKNASKRDGKPALVALPNKIAVAIDLSDDVHAEVDILDRLVGNEILNLFDCCERKPHK